MSEEVWLLWKSPAQFAGPSHHQYLYGVFLTEFIANRRLDEMQKAQPNAEWKVTRREIGVLGEE